MTSTIPKPSPRLVRTIAKLSWYVYAKPSFANAEHVLQYSAGTRTASRISNSACSTSRPTTSAFEQGGASRRSSLSRFCALRTTRAASGFRKISTSACTPRRQAAHRLLPLECTGPGGRTAPLRDRLLELSGRDIERCPRAAAPFAHCPAVGASTTGRGPREPSSNSGRAPRRTSICSTATASVFLLLFAKRRSFASHTLRDS